MLFAQPHRVRGGILAGGDCTVAEAGDCLGIDIGATKWVALGPAGRKIGGRMSDHPAECLAAIREAVCGILPGARAAAVSFAGSVDDNGIVDGWPNRPSWIGTDLAAGILPAGAPSAVVADDGLCAALGERNAAAAGLDDYLCLTFGTGIGGVIVLDGKPREGLNRAGRTFGHIRLRGAVEPCRCGDRGCLQAVILGAGSGERELGRMIEGIERSRLGVLVSDWVCVLGLRGVVLTGGLLGHVPAFAEHLVAALRADAADLGFRIRLSATPHESSLRGALALARIALTSGA